MDEVKERLEDGVEGQDYTGDVDSDYSDGDELILMPGNCDDFSDLEVELQLLEADGTLIIRNYISSSYIGPGS